MAESRPTRAVVVATASFASCVVAACSLLVDTGGLVATVEATDAQRPLDSAFTQVFDAADAGDPNQATGDSGTGDASDVASTDASVDAADGGRATATSCAPADGTGRGVTDCGPVGGESCCASPPIPTGTFLRSYDGVGHTNTDYQATVRGFRLDRFEVTVGRYRKFVAATNGGWLPSEGSGKHAHVSGGKGLSSEMPGTYEPGWNAAWNAKLSHDQLAWTTNLSCNPTFQTWTTLPGPNESRPLVCATWFEAYAFCIWDGGFLPSETEWNDAAAGGGEQRVYPWSKAPASIDASYANYNAGAGALLSVGNTPKGDGKWLHADLAGNVWEWVLDGYQATYPFVCDDCVALASIGNRVIRGGGLFNEPSALTASNRDYYEPSQRFFDVGLRCARTP